MELIKEFVLEFLLEIGMKLVKIKECLNPLDTFL